MRFVGFFKPLPSSTAKKDAAQALSKNDTGSSSLSDLFHPFHIKKDTTLAPINRLAKDITKETIDKALNFNGVSEGSTDMDIDSDHNLPVMAKEAAKEILRVLFPKCQRPDGAFSTSRKKRLPSNYRSMTVSEVVQSGLLLQDELSDSNYMFTWRDIPSLRMRLLQFAENYRPAYYGKEEVII